VIEKTISNLDLNVTYYNKGKFNCYDAYKNLPFKISLLPNHAQPLFIKFSITFLNEDYFQLKAESKRAYFYNFETGIKTTKKNKWTFTRNGKIGELIETPDLAFIVEPPDIPVEHSAKEESPFAFEFVTLASLRSAIKNKLSFDVVDRAATVIKISLESESSLKGIEIVNELMNVYSAQNLETKNHIATITIDYIERQLNEITDS
jgi:hypothetical protein